MIGSKIACVSRRSAKWRYFMVDMGDPFTALQVNILAQLIVNSILPLFNYSVDRTQSLPSWQTNQHQHHVRWLLLPLFFWVANLPYCI